MKHKTTQNTKATSRHQAFYQQKAFLWPVGLLVGFVLAVFLAFATSPWPGALLVRADFNHNGRKTTAALQKHTPRTPITVFSDQNYQTGNNRAQLDVYTPASAQNGDQKLPVIIWTHGGAWVSGDKTDSAPYFKLLAAKGFAVVSLNYTLAPEQRYPSQLFELNAAHRYLINQASRFHIDTSTVFLAGDSAGAQLTSQMSALITNPSYAHELHIKPTLQPSQLAGSILFCGIYQMKGLTEADPKLPKIISWGDNQVVWAYSGTRDYDSPIIRQMSPYYHVTKDLPTTFISGGNADPLTKKQSKPLAQKLQSMGVPVTTVFYAADHQPALPHEYQFNLDNQDGQRVFAQLTDFLQKTAQLPQSTSQR